MGILNELKADMGYLPGLSGIEDEPDSFTKPKNYGQ